MRIADDTGRSRADPPAPAEPVLRAMVEEAASGHMGAFRELFGLYSDRVFRYASLRLGGRQEAEDVVQDVFLSVWRGLPSFRYEHAGSFPGWLFQIAARRVADRLRRGNSRRWAPLEAVPETGARFEEQVVLDRLVRDGLATLPEKQREVLVLRFLAGLRLREVAEAIGRTESAVTSLQMRGLDRLRRYMETDDES